jgi:hypothetical protein
MYILKSEMAYELKNTEHKIYVDAPEFLKKSDYISPVPIPNTEVKPTRVFGGTVVREPTEIRVRRQLFSRLIQYTHTL